MSDDQHASGDGHRPQDRRREPARPRVAVDSSHVQAGYANFCRVTGTPEEVLLDFGLNEQPIGEPDRPIRINQRIIVNFYTAKRMLGALQMTVKRHEQAFGRLEIDVHKRVTAPGPEPKE